MRIPLSNLLVLLLTAAIAVGAACKKSEEPAAETAAEESEPAPTPLRGADQVVAALERKDYQGAVGALASVKAQATPAQMDEYRELRREVQDALVQAMGSNPAAAEAYRVMRYVETGR